MIYELVEPSDETLRTPVDVFDFDNPATDPIQLAKDLAETMVHHAGLGLAAPQLGLPYSCFVMGSNPVLACFNPRIVDTSSDEIKLLEGCLTYPGLFLNIRRSRNIRARYTQPNGEIVTRDFDGMTARVFQHETDHLNGILFLSHVTRLELDIAKRKRLKARKREG